MFLIVDYFLFLILVFPSWEEDQNALTNNENQYAALLGSVISLMLLPLCYHWVKMSSPDFRFCLK